MPDTNNTNFIFNNFILISYPITINYKCPEFFICRVFKFVNLKISGFFFTSSKRHNTPSFTILGAWELCFDKKSKKSLKWYSAVIVKLTY